MNEDSERKEDEMNAGLSVLERDLLQSTLRDLPETTPPRAVWERIEEQARAEGLFRPRFGPHLGEGMKWFAGAGIAAAVVLAVLQWPPTGPGDIQGEKQYSHVPELTEDPQTTGLRALNALMVESRQIERDLRALPAQPSLVRAGTAATIVELEDRIAAIDYRLNHPDIALSPAQAEAYWRERVRLMNLLLQLRTAQASRMTF